MSRFPHILVPIDFTPKNREALDTARELAVANGARVTLLHIVQSISVSEDEPLAAFYQSLKTEANRRLETYAAPLREVGIDVRPQVLVGEPARAIVTEASVAGVSLIVLSSHALGDAENEGNWATVSYQVSVFCRCAVLLVK